MSAVQELIDDLIERRRLLGLSFHEVGRRIGQKDGSNVHIWEKKRSIPRSDLLFAWCGALGLEIKVTTIPRQSGAQAAG